MSVLPTVRRDSSLSTAADCHVTPGQRDCLYLITIINSRTQLTVSDHEQPRIHGN